MHHFTSWALQFASPSCSNVRSSGSPCLTGVCSPRQLSYHCHPPSINSKLTGHCTTLFWFFSTLTMTPRPKLTFSSSLSSLRTWSSLVLTTRLWHCCRPSSSAICRKRASRPQALTSNGYIAQPALCAWYLVHCTSSSQSCRSYWTWNTQAPSIS